MDRDAAALVDRVRKLLALATSPNVHEAAAAAARAQAMIDDHRLAGLLDEQDRADADVTDGQDQPLEQARRIRKWKTVLAGRLADLNGCVAYTAGHRGHQKLLLAGHPVDRVAVIEVWSWLTHRMELLSASHGAGQDRAWHDAFRIGAAETIAARMAETQTVVRAALETTALVRVQPALARRADAVQRFVDQQLRLKPGRGMSLDADGYARGKAAGGGLDLATGET